ncbi:MAG: hypothetical protein SR1Q7_00230 [Quinella sp. 1Q7]|nr:hypothetical protein [Quinella sp. 1Q7]
MLYELYNVKGNPPQSPDGFTFDLQRFDSAFGGGSGTESDPYKISAVEHLQQLATDVNGGNTYEGVYFKLTADIDLTGVDFAPIGNRNNMFNGTFDGAGFTISNLKISTGGNNVGLFGYVGEGGTIMNVTLDNVNVSGGDSVGGLIGANRGTIENCTVSGKVTGTGTGSDSYVGGLVGRNNTGTVSGNTAISNVSGTGNGVGGLVGYNSGGTVSGNTQLYLLTLPKGVTATGDTVITIDGKTYAVGSVTLKATDASKLLQNVTVNGESDDDGVFEVTADTTITADVVSALVFNQPRTAVTVGGSAGDLSTESGVYSITASQQNSTLVGNAKNNTFVLTGGGENILTGGSGNDTFKFSAGGGIVTDYGIGATKSGDGSPLENPPGTDVIKLDGKVSGVYFDRDASTKKSPTFTAIVTYNSTADNDTQVIVLQNINKKPTKYSSDPSKAVYQTNDAAAATLKIWDMSGSKQAVISASKLKKLFRDDSDLSDELKTQIASLGKLDGIGDLNLPAVDQLNQNTQATFNGGE